jgi:hypothetical protein
MRAGPARPMMMDQKYAGFSRAAQRQYRKGPAQKRGVGLDMACCSTGSQLFVI